MAVADDADLIGWQPRGRALAMVEEDDPGRFVHRRLRRRLLLGLVALVILVVFLASLLGAPTVLLTYPADDDSTVATRDDCVIQVRGIITGLYLPGAQVRLSIRTDATWFEQAVADIERGRFRVNGRLGGGVEPPVDGYPHDIKVELLDLGGLVPRASTIVLGVKRANRCT